MHPESSDGNCPNKNIQILLANPWQINNFQSTFERTTCGVPQMKNCMAERTYCNQIFTAVVMVIIIDMMHFKSSPRGTLVPLSLDSTILTCVVITFQNILPHISKFCVRRSDFCVIFAVTASLYPQDKGRKIFWVPDAGHVNFLCPVCSDRCLRLSP